MDDASIDLQRAARDAAYSMPLDQIDPADPELFRTDTMWPYFERLRKEDPVHWAESEFEDVGGYWSVTRYNDIMAIDTNHQVFSSDPTIVLPDPAEDFNLPMFIAMDPP
ncbi:MAG: cytochrome P450, partial [Phenylobacterium sp.]|nr:cytochrome P450 [Phenylobacterium sp.]